ncbi:MAG TPA: methyltransferase [Actinophytocola sp.]|uniref:methyltransferase n=1 Tax=Actinophytocola sp. TaxID=1872138 RepID=UPI002DBA769D|nr:methyltransferase [Actinophytocola sp.]HEU5473538.1 methyltransferase [Actinophytocola sp.]
MTTLSLDFGTRKEMVSLLQGAWRARAIHVAVELGIPDLLGERDQTVAELAETTGAHEPTLARLLRALASFGVFQRLDDGRTYASTPLSEVLQTKPGCAESADARFMAAPWHWAAWGQLLHSVRTGESAFEVANNGVSFWELTSSDPDAKERFNAAMSSVSEEESAEVARVYDFSRFPRIVDVAGGLGSLLGAILAAHPGVHGTLLERDEIIPLAERLLGAAGVAGRYELVAGDFFDKVPEQADLYLIKRALHDWDGDDIVRILSRIRDAMRPDSTLLVLEGVIDEDSDEEDLFRGLLLTVLCGGQDRTERDYRELIERAGLQVRRTIPVSGSLRILEATRA